MATTPVMVWFRNDLRLGDNPALHAAIQTGAAVVPLFVWSPGEEGGWPPGGAGKWWLGQSLAALGADLERLGSRLILRQGGSLVELERLAAETGARQVFWNRSYEPAAMNRDAEVEARLWGGGIEVQTFNGSLLFEPAELQTREGKPFQVFTPFWKSCLSRLNISETLPAPARLTAPSSWPTSLRVSDLNLAPVPDWAGGMRQTWTPGERGAAKRWQRFVEDALAGYEADRNRPDLAGSSRLSPHLHFGEISPRQIWHECLAAACARHGVTAADRNMKSGAECYLREIGWREFAYHLLHHFPHTTDKPLRKEFEHFPWNPNPAHLRAWQRGLTGYPIVDAGMRELWATGWMHNRVRMIAASFLVKDLLIPWQEGARWFWDTLVDADLANNTLGWQWTAGCGADAAPYFRVFNPVLQGRKFDPEGLYVRRWIPELAALPNEHIHKPWEAPPMILEAAKVKLDETYPNPIIDHAQAREWALTAFEKIKAGRTN